MDDVLLLLVLYSHAVHRFIVQPIFCRSLHHLSPEESAIVQKLIRVLPLMFAQLILPPPGQRYNADGYIPKRIPPHTAIPPWRLQRQPAPIIERYERGEIKPSIEMAKKMADELGVTVDYLIGGSTSMVLDKKLLKRMEDIEALPEEKKEKIYYFIDIAVTYNKTKKAYSR